MWSAEFSFCNQLSCFWLIRLGLTFLKTKHVLKSLSPICESSCESVTPQPDSQVIAHAHHGLKWSKFQVFWLINSRNKSCFKLRASMSLTSQKKGMWWGFCGNCHLTYLDVPIPPPLQSAMCWSQTQLCNQKLYCYLSSAEQNFVRILAYSSSLYFLEQT